MLKHIDEIIEHLRQRGFSYTDIQGITGVRTYQIQAIVNGVKLPPLYEREAISRYLAFTHRVRIWNKTEAGAL